MPQPLHHLLGAVKRHGGFAGGLRGGVRRGGVRLGLRDRFLTGGQGFLFGSVFRGVSTRLVFLVRYLLVILLLVTLSVLLRLILLSAVELRRGVPRLTRLRR